MIFLIFGFRRQPVQANVERTAPLASIPRTKRSRLVFVNCVTYPNLPGNTVGTCRCLLEIPVCDNHRQACSNGNITRGNAPTPFEQGFCGHFSSQSGPQPRKANGRIHNLPLLCGHTVDPSISLNPFTIQLFKTSLSVFLLLFNLLRPFGLFYYFGPVCIATGTAVVYY